mgnify:CR=1 FL=1
MSLQLNGGKLILGNGIDKEQFVINTDDNKFNVKNQDKTLMELKYEDSVKSVVLSNNKYDLKNRTR